MCRYKLFLLPCLLLSSLAESSIFRLRTRNAKEPYKLDEFLTRKFVPKQWNGTWFSGSSFYYKNENGDIRIYDVQNQSDDLLLSRNVLKKYKGASTTFSNDRLYLLITYNVSSLFRHSTTAQFTIYDIKNNQYYDVADKAHIQYAEWSPVGHALVYVLENNIYYLDDPANVQKPKQITDDGVQGVIYNGVPDWVYEEEVLASGSALWFSPDGKHLAFASFNDTQVPDYFYFIYGQPGNLRTQYPLLAALKYPKVGATNPIVKTYLVDLDNSTPTKREVAAIPETYLPADYVLYNVIWPNNEEVSFQVSNRVQNDAKLMRCTLNGKCHEESSYSERQGWLELHKPIYSKDGTRRLEILPANEGKWTFYHIILMNIDARRAVRLTRGERVVTDIIKWDEDNNKVYYKSSVENHPSRIHAYVVDTRTLEDKCLTCDIMTPSGRCLVGDVKPSPDHSHYVSVCRGPGPTYVTLHKTSDNAIAVVWESNAELLRALSRKSKPIIRDYVIPTQNGHEIRTRLYFPPDYSASCTRKYPAIVQVYAGPNSNKISDAYSIDVRNYWVTNRKYIYIHIDGRGSGLGSIEKMFEVYRRLGTVEVDDQINATRYLQEFVPCLDAENTGIWGWSYGGFATLLALIKDKENVFKFGIAVAPVTNFIYYDTTYTERYMGLPTPEDNLKGYNNTDVSSRVEALRGKSFFIIHGNADDNVHYQQSMLLSKALEAADIQFRQMSYPDENHSLGHVYPHLYHTLDRYIAEQFGQPLPSARPGRMMHKKPA